MLVARHAGTKYSSSDGSGSDFNEEGAFLADVTPKLMKLDTAAAAAAEEGGGWSWTKSSQYLDPVMGRYTCNFYSPAPNWRMLTGIYNYVKIDLILFSL